MAKKGCCQPGCENLKLNVSQVWTVGIKWFFT